jgi:uncharacterized phage protein (TIGR01671 family)
MRDIKFRAWIKPQPDYDEPGRMVSVVMMGLPNDDGHEWEEEIFNGQRCTYGYDDDSILMQFTGLRDKNGKEIYEGDLVVILSYGTRSKAFSVEYGEQDHEDSGKSIGFNLNPEFVDAYEVIGNIYENPEK